MTHAPSIDRRLDALEALHGAIAPLPPTTAFEWIVYDTASYLVDDDTRAAVFEEVGALTGHSPARLLRCDAELLLTALAKGGMKKEMRLGKLLDAATLCAERHGGDLHAFLDAHRETAERELRRYPGVGLPGARKILLFTGRRDDKLGFESNALRVVERLGLVDDQGSYDKTYRSAEERVTPKISGGGDGRRRAHLLLREHGKSVCRNTVPDCPGCPLQAGCKFASTTSG